MTTLISFLGATDYRDTIYVYRSRKSHATRYMADAAMALFEPAPQRLLVVVTEEARTKHLEALTRNLSGVIEPEPVMIPSGQSEAEQWTIFERIAAQIRPNEELIFDITNGFRSIPVLALLIAAYVRVARRATVRHLIYGAFDARNPDNETPVFDLTPLAALLEWTTATDALLKYGRADALRDLVQQLAHARSSSNQLAQQLHQLTAALQASRPAEVMRTAATLPEALAAFSEPNATDGSTRPLGLLLGAIEQEYGPMALAQPYERRLAREVIGKQLEMIVWYVAKGLYVQAFTLTREWLISVVLAAADSDGAYDLYSESDRKLAETAINGYDQTSESPPRPVPTRILEIANQPAIRSLWKDCRALRNDLAHAGMRRSPEAAEQVEKRVGAVCSRLRPALQALGFEV